MAGASVFRWRRRDPTFFGSSCWHSPRDGPAKEAARGGTHAQVATRIGRKGRDDELAPFASAFATDNGKRGQAGSVEPMYSRCVEPDIFVRVPENVQQDPGTVRVERAGCGKPTIGRVQTEHWPSLSAQAGVAADADDHCHPSERSTRLPVQPSVAIG